MSPSIALEREERVALVLTVPEPYRSHFWRGLGFYEAQKWLLTASGGNQKRELELVREGAIPIEELLAPFPEEARLQVSWGLGSGLRAYITGKGRAKHLIEAIRDGLVAVVGRGSPWAWGLVEGAAVHSDYPPPWRKVPQVMARSEELLALLPPGMRAGYARGLGEVCGRILARDIPPETAFVRRLLQRVAGPGGVELWVGVGRGLALDAQEPAWPGWVDGLEDPGRREAVRRGFDAELARRD